MKTIKLISGMLIVAAFLAVGSFQGNAFGKTKPASNTERVNLVVSGMYCPYCSQALKTKLSSLKGVENVSANYKTGCASFECPYLSKLNKAQINNAVKSAGFTLKEVKYVEKPAQKTAKVKTSSW